MRIVANTGTDRVVDILRPWLRDGNRVDLASGTLSIFAFGELAGGLAHLAGARLVVPPDGTELDLLGGAADRAARNRLRGRWLAGRCAAWIEKATQVRKANGSVPQGAIVLRNGDGLAGQALLGSFSFSTDGLGLAPSNPFNLIQASETPGEFERLGAWFDDQWSSLADGDDAKRELVAALHSLAAQREPSSIYGLILDHLFGSEGGDLDEERVVKSATGIRDTEVWKRLYKFQRDGVVGAIDKLERFGGCMIADSVGLGKTFEALAIIKYHELRNDRVLVLCPKRLRDNWSLYRANDRTLRPCPEDRVDWNNTRNLVIEGDNLEALKLLQKSYAGKVKLIYIDPPYNTGSDFVYPDDYRDSMQNYLELTGQVDGERRKLSSNPEASGRYHTQWLNMMYPRLKLGRDLLRKDGVVCISIDEVELANLIGLCNDIFGEQNKLAELIWKCKSGGANDSQHFAVDHEYIVVYAKSAVDLQLHRDPNATVTTKYNKRDEFGEYALDRLDKQSIRYSPSLDYEISGPDGTVYKPAHRDPSRPNATWRWSKKKVADQYTDLVFSGGYVYTKNYKSDGTTPRSLLTEDRFGRTRTGKTECRGLMEAQVFDNPKPTKLLRHLLTIASSDDDVVLDFFAGSGTTGHAVLAQNVADGGCRRFVVVQLPMPLGRSLESQKDALYFCESLGRPHDLVEITKERLRRAGRHIAAENLDYGGDLGFRVFKLGTSSLRAWNSSTNDLDADLLASVDHIESGRTEQDLLTELLLKLGLDLCVPTETRTIVEKPVHSVGAGTLVVCLDEDISLDDVEPLGQGIADWHDALAPSGERR